VIRRFVDERPTYGYRRIAALLKRERRSAGLAPINVKRVYRLMKKHGLLLGSEWFATLSLHLRLTACASVAGMQCCHCRFGFVGVRPFYDGLGRDFARLTVISR